MLYTVIGTQNVGKSTFIKDFLKQFDDWKSPSIDYRSIVTSKGLKLNREGNLFSQEVLFDFILNDTLNYSFDNGKTILDRSIIDAHVYTLWLYLNRPEASGVTLEAISKQFKTIQANISCYDKIFYIPLKECQSIAIEDDKFRDTNPEYRKEIDGLFEDVLGRLNFPNVARVFGDRQQRVEMAWDNMDEPWKL